MPDTGDSWKAVAKANGEHSERTHLGATCFEHVYVIFCVLISTHTRQSAQENDC